MQIYVINLDRRLDRLENIQKELSSFSWERFPAFDGLDKKFDGFELEGWFADSSWIDPFLKSKVTLGEIGCLASHYTLWQKIAASDSPAIILEDDVFLENSFDLQDIQNKISNCDLLYLGYREVNPDKVQKVSDDLVKPHYPYHTSSYAITPAGARKLISTHIRTKIIPADEYLAIMTGYDAENNNELKPYVNEYSKYDKLNALAYSDNKFRQYAREKMGTDTVQNEQNVSYEENVKNSLERENIYHIVTVATDEEMAKDLFTSGNKFHATPVNLGSHKKWSGGEMKRLPGGGQKFNLLKKYLNKLKDDDWLVFLDGYDTVFVSHINELKIRTISSGYDIIFSAEKTCWPDESLSELFPPSRYNTKYRYPNDGLFAGHVKALRKFFEKELQDDDDSHLYVAKRFLELKDTLKLEVDSENYIFQNTRGIEPGELEVADNGQLRNAITKCRPCILHGSGSIQDKKVYKKLVRQLEVGKLDSILAPYIRHFEVGKEIFQIDFLSPSICRKIIDDAEEFGEWESLYGDAVPGKELRIKKFDPDLYTRIEEYFDLHVRRFVTNVWSPLGAAPLRDAFIIRFSADTQAELACHNDASLVSGLVRLNDDYTGGDTYWYRQHYSNKNQPVGSMILWPGQVTHGHEGRPVKSGVKYNMVFWTKRANWDTV